MNKREKSKKLKSVFYYLQDKLVEAFERRSNDDFDWYSEGGETFSCLIQDKPITLTPRTKDLSEIK